ncbi:MAG: STAS domain-containing protein [Rhodocyclaceae bacterium]|nr:STAS domain-containing protein [Rhodocyclaceae bacterium]
MASPIFGKKPAAEKPTASRRREVARASAAKKPPAPTELSTIDFGDASVALSDCAGQVEVQEVGPGLGAAFEEAAVLYANGDVREAEAALESVLGEGHGAAGEGLWMMLLDLFRLTGQKDRFESRVLDYATRFERSPPPWTDLSNKVRRAKADVVPLINLVGVLSTKTADQIGQIRVIGERSGSIRVDLKRLRGCDEEGCHLLLQLIRDLRAERAKLTILNASQLAELLAAQVKVGEASNKEGWLLLLEMLQHTDEFERFEQIALDYAITFEESPPSWEAVERIATEELREIEEEQARSESTFVFEGELINAGGDTLRNLAAFASERSAVEVDCTDLRRMDFVTAGTLFNILSTLRTQGKQIKLQNVNAMVAALLRVMGVDQVAQVMVRA